MPSKTFFGHPSVLRILFFTELWERFSYYGMRAILVLFMVAPAARQGLGIDDTNAASIYGLYTMCVYMLALPGGWLADNFFGLKKAVFYGGCVIALGHFVMAFPGQAPFFAGLILIAMGTGLLKPNISCMVGNLYSNDDQAKRDAAFSIFYVGINIGGFIAPFIVGYFGERINWHLGFAISGFGMLLGLIYFKQNWNRFDKLSADVPPLTPASRRKVRAALALFLFVMGVTFLGTMTNLISFNPSIVAQYSFFILGGCAIIYFTSVLLSKSLDQTEKKNVAIIIALFCFSIVFYLGYEQEGSSLTLFAERFTQRVIGSFEVPASWFQSLPSFYVFTLAPIFAWLWIWCRNKGISITIPQKFSAGLFFTALGFLCMVIASYIFAQGEKASYMWLVVTFGLNTIGEICLYPVGLSAVTLLSPKRLSGQMMGVWFLSLSLGNLLAGIYAGNFKVEAITANPMLQAYLFAGIAAILLVALLIMSIMSRSINRSGFETQHGDGEKAQAT